jgi:hypothetical protein
LYSITHKGLQVDAYLGNCSDPILGADGSEAFGEEERGKR